MRPTGIAPSSTAVALTLALGAASPVPGAGVTIVVENLAPENGTWITPVWVGFHDGSFDLYDPGAPASMALERLAEDGNTGPLAEAFAASGAGSHQATLVADTGIPPLAPGETATMTFVLDEHDPTSRYLSFASMVIPSNDAFIANGDPLAHRLFDAGGNFLGGFITIYGADVRDAGTEVNDEIPEHTAFFGQSAPDTGDPENGVVHDHAGPMPPGSGGVLDDPMFAGADFSAPGYEVARIFVFRTDTVIPAGTVSGTWNAAGSPYLIEGDVTVPPGETLTIEPGVTVFFQSWYALTVNGHLDAIGTEESPILFTATEPGPGEPGWKGVRFVNDRSASRMSYCTVENGQVMGVEPYKRGGGVACDNSNPWIDHCTIRDNRASVAGGGIYVSSGSAPVISQCLLTGNVTGYLSSASGGGLSCVGSTVEITGCTFEDNLASASGGFVAAHGRGGAIHLFESDALITGNVIAGNEVYAFGNVGTSSRGGGIYVSGSGGLDMLHVSGNTLVGNLATGGGTEGGGIHLTNSAAQIVNTIVAGSTFGGGIHFGSGTGAAGVSYCDLSGNLPADFTGAVPAGLGDLVTENANGDPADVYLNILLAPMFVDAPAGDFHLLETSPCIDAGDPETAYDPDGTVADIGALFFEQEVPVVGDIDGDGMVGFDDLLLVLSAWGNCPAPPAACATDLDGNGAVGFADLVIVLANWS